MKWFLDTEFNEDGRTIELISIALVAEDGRCYYAASTEFNRATCNEWVQANVLPKLPTEDWRWRDRATIARDIRMLLLGAVLPEGEPEIWGYFADYDWVVLCQLFGRMVDLPKGFPFWCRDLKQLMQDRGVEKKDLPAEDPASEHDALADARWIRAAYLHIATQQPPETQGGER